MKALRAIVAAVLVGVFLAGCSTTRAVEGPQEINDPFERFNRVMFNTTLRFDRFVLRPTAIVYRAVFPQPIRDGVRNFLNNLDSPVILTNDLLQGELARAKITLVRTVVNTTVGIGGLFDVADRWGFPRHREDFGQTLATFGIGEGPYLFIPLLGPTTVRDGTGVIVRIAVGPVGYIPDVPLRNSLYGVGYVDLRAQALDAGDIVDKAALDRYTFIRNAYLQRRRYLIYDGKPPPDTEDDQ